MLKAVGAGELAAAASGINVARFKILAFAISGSLAAIAGLIFAVKLSGGAPTIANGFLLPAIVAVLVGGTPLTGGVGSIQGTILGALIITILSNGMNIIGLDPYFQNIIKGLVLILSVFVTIDRKKIGIIK